MAAPSVPFGLLVVNDDPVSGTGEVIVDDYVVTYEDNLTSGHQSVIDLGNETEDGGETSGLLVVSGDRELWTVGERQEAIEFAGNGSVTIGDVGWRETVTAERTGWSVLGNDSVYAVDLVVDGESTRSFESDAARAGTTIDGYEIDVSPTDTGFALHVIDDGEIVGETEIPAVNETASVVDVTFETVEEEEEEAEERAVRVYATFDETSIPIAERESPSS